LELSGHRDEEANLLRYDGRREGLVVVDALLLKVAEQDGARLPLDDVVVGVRLDSKNSLAR
jgi:hypothetical protein